MIADLFGGCDPGTEAAEVSPEAFVSGPLAARRALPAERAEIVAAARAAHFKAGQDRCVRYHVRVSEIDDRFAAVSYSFVRPYEGCLLGNGVSLMQRTAHGRWQLKGDAGDAFSCASAPTGVIRSLLADCVIVGGPRRLL